MKLKSTTYYWMAVIFGGVGMGTAMGAIDASASKNVSKSGTCILLSFFFLIVDHKLVQRDLEILCELEQL
jgi:hypothetical protein